MKHPESLIEAVRYFSDLDACHWYMVSIRWSNGPVKCPKCSGTNVGEIVTRRMFQCKAKECRKQFSAKVGTIFEDSKLGLDKWFVAVWSIANCKNGISSHELARSLGITQKSAWYMLHRVRLAMQTRTFRKIKGVIESDETFIGGRLKNMHKSKRDRIKRGPGWIGKQIVHGLLERGSDVRLKVLPNTKRPTMLSAVRSEVEPGAAVYTDQLASYVGLEADFVHRMIDHAKEYVRGAVHTNGLENFWSLLKRSIRGSYVWVSPEHLQAYLDEQAFRYNCRKFTDGERFRRVLRMVTGRRLTRSELTSREAVA